MFIPKKAFEKVQRGNFDAYWFGPSGIWCLHAEDVEALLKTDTYMMYMATSLGLRDIETFIVDEDKFLEECGNHGIYPMLIVVPAYKKHDTWNKLLERLDDTVTDEAQRGFVKCVLNYNKRWLYVYLKDTFNVDETLVVDPETL